MEEILKKLIREHELQAISTIGQAEIEGVEAGEMHEYRTAFVSSCFNILTPRIDKLIDYDRQLNKGSLSPLGQKALALRGFTFPEYQDLFSSLIPEEEYCFYPIFGQLTRRGQRGIYTAKQREEFTSKYTNDKEGYLQALYENGYQQHCEFFFDWIKFTAHLPLKKMFSHVGLFAPSGTGKTVFMESIFFRMTKKYTKYSFVLIDPHGDISERAKIHRHLKERLIYIDPFFQDGYSPCFNPFQINDTSIKNITNVAEQIIGAFEEVLSREGGALTETMIFMLEKCVYFLLQRSISTVADLVQLLNCDQELFEEAAEYDPYFNDYFLKPNNKTREALFTRIGRMLNSPVLSNLIGGRSTFNLEQALNSGKVIIFNLGDLGEMSQIAFGKFIIASIKSIVRKRKKPSKKLHTFLFLDEAPTFVSKSYETILSQLRGFGLHFVLACQYVEQFGNQLKAVKKNTAIKIVGGGDDNKDDMQKMIDIPKNDSLKDYEFYLKVRSRNLVKFKSPNFLLKKKKKHYLTKEEEKELDQHLIQKYYKVIGTEPTIREVMQKAEDTPIKVKKNDAPLPPFRLLIQTHDKTTK